MATCEARLKREIKMFFKDPVEHIIVSSCLASVWVRCCGLSCRASLQQVCPSPRDIKEMNFVLLGPAGSPYEGSCPTCLRLHRVCCVELASDDT